jgi:amino acid transporter
MEFLMSVSSSSPPVESGDLDAEAVQDNRLHRQLGFWSLTAAGLGGIIGSGWLFGALYGAKAAGPASLLSWVIAGAAFALVALVLAELGASRPESGALVRWPLYASGPLVAAIVGWVVLLSIGAATASEASAVAQYANRYIPGLYQNHVLTPWGLVASIALLAALVLLNWFGIRLFARINTLVTTLKFVVPGLTIIVLLLSGFHSGHLTDEGGFAPYGWSAVLSAVTSGGIIFAVNGFASVIELSGEAKNARRDVPRAVLAAIGLAVLLYLGLQFAFLVAIPDSLLSHGWHGIDLSSPFGEIALLLNLGWLAAVLYADAVISPAGSALVGAAEDGRRGYALAKNGLIPSFFIDIHPGSGVPRRALVGTFVFSILWLAPFRGWQEIVSVLGDLFLVTYSVIAVAGGAFHTADPRRHSQAVPGLRWIAPLSFVIATQIVYWSTWDDLSIGLPLALAGVLIFAGSRRGRGDFLTELRRGLWLIAHFAVLFAVSAAGSFGGAKLLPAPWDSLLIAVASLGLYYWGVRSGLKFLATGAADPVADTA